MITEPELLALWEAALAQPPVARALTLAAAAGDRVPADLVDVPLGARDALLLSLREVCFGRRLSAEVTCPRCADRLELDLSIDDVRVADAGADRASRLVELEVAGSTVAFRPVTSRDLLGLDGGGPQARRELVSRCVVPGGTGPRSVGDEIVDAVTARLGQADPQADIVLALTCSSCAHEWQAPFDIASYVWLEVDSYARRLLSDIHALATAYGWSEADALAVSPVRRRFYLDAVPA